MQLWERFAGKTYHWNRRTNSLAGTGTGIRVFVRIPSILFLLGEELYRQSKAVYKYWAGGLRSCYHAVSSSSSSSSSTSL